MDDPGEGLGHQAGAADECTVDVGLGHEVADVLRLDRTAVEDARGFGGLEAAEVAELVADDAMGFFGDFPPENGSAFGTWSSTSNPRRVY